MDWPAATEVPLDGEKSTASSELPCCRDSTAAAETTVETRPSVVRSLKGVVESMVRCVDVGCGDGDRPLYMGAALSVKLRSLLREHLRMSVWTQPPRPELRPVWKTLTCARRSSKMYRFLAVVTSQGRIRVLVAHDRSGCRYISILGRPPTAACRTPMLICRSAEGPKKRQIEPRPSRRMKAAGILSSRY